jgi:hypothetical protein
MVDGDEMVEERDLGTARRRMYCIVQTSSLETGTNTRRARRMGRDRIVARRIHMQEGTTGDEADSHMLHPRLSLSL